MALWSNAGAQQSPSIAPDLRQHSANTATKTAPQVTEFLSSNMHKVYAVDIVYALGADFRTRVWTPKWPKMGPDWWPGLENLAPSIQLCLESVSERSRGQERPPEASCSRN